MEVLFNKNEINFKGNKKNLDYNVSDSYVMESHYIFKNLNKNNLKKILSNLSSYNYEDVVNGYEKIYDNNKPFEYTEKIYKNGKLIDTKEYSTSSINTKNLKTTSKNEVQNNNNFSNNSNKTKEVSLNKNDNSSENNAHNTLDNTNKENKNLKNNDNSSYTFLIFIFSILGLILIINIYKLFFKKNKDKKLKYFEYIDLGDRKAVRYKGNLLNSSINYKFLCDRKNILLFIAYKNGSPTSVKFSISSYYIDIDIKN